MRFLGIDKRIIAVLLSVTFASNYLISQDNRFNVGIILGSNFSELEGESITDYVGINTGIFTAAKLSDKFQLGIELLFSQNGEYILPSFYPDIEYGKIRLNHLEIPIHLNYLAKINKEDKLHELDFSLGIAYTRLLSHYVEHDNGEEVSSLIIYDDRDAYLGQLGVTYPFSERLGLNFRASLPIRNEALDWTLALRLIYKIL